MRTTLALLLFATAAHGQIASSNRIDWSAGVTVGVLGGIPLRETVFTNLDTAASSASISAAIQACPSNQVVQLTNGTFTLTNYITFGGRDGVTLRGHPSGTVLAMTNAGVGLMVLMAGTAGDAGQTTLGVGVPLTSGYTKGSTSVVAASTAGLSQHQSMILTQDDDTNFVIRASGSLTNGALRQRVVIQSVDGSNVVFWPPLVWTFESALNPRLYAAGDQIERSGIESIEFLPGPESVSVLAYLNNARECWFAGNRCTNFPAAGIELNWTTLCEVRSNYIFGTSSTSDGYGIKVNSDTSSALVEDNILGDCYHSIIASQHSGCVFAYNFSTNNWVDNGFAGMTRSYNANHGPHPIMSLWEGNVGNGFENDGYHGSGSHQTVFRNSFPAVQSQKPDAHGQIVDLRRWSYYQQIVGNILGADWATNHVKYFYEATAAEWAAASSTDNGTIYLCGYYATPLDAQVEATATKAYNWDGWTQGIVNDTGSPAASLFRSERPSWFGGVSWPPIGPDVSGLAKMIPAEYRFRGLDLPSTLPAATAGTVNVGTLIIAP